MGRKMIEEKFLNKSKFTEIVEETVIEKQLSYMDAVLYICDMNSIDLEDVKKFISPNCRLVYGQTIIKNI